MNPALNRRPYKAEPLTRPTLSSPLSRRAVLRGAGGAAIGLPLLEAMTPRRAQAAGEKRFIFFYFSNGVVKDAWTPAGGETGFTLPSTLEPLKPLQNKLVVLSGLDMECSRFNPGNPHNQGIITVLTARRGTTDMWGSDISVDQAIAEKIGQQTKYPSLQFGVQTMRFYGASKLAYCSYAGEKKPVPCEDDPGKMFERIFTDVVTPTGSGAAAALAAQEARVARRKSLLDFMGSEFKQFSASLPAGDRGKVDAHLEKIREIERRLALSAAATPATSAGCRQPTIMSPAGAATKNDAFPVVGKLQMDLIAMAMTCDLTRVALLQWGTSQAFNTFPWADAPRAHHPLSHETVEPSNVLLRRIQRWFMEQLAYLGGALDAVKDPGGSSILDSTALLSCSEVAVGATHSFRDMPFLLLGGAGGAIRGGRHLTFPSTPHNDLHISLLNAMGIPAKTFGDPKYVRGPLPGLLG